MQLSPGISGFNPKKSPGLCYDCLLYNLYIPKPSMQESSILSYSLGASVASAIRYIMSVSLLFWMLLSHEMRRT